MIYIENIYKLNERLIVEKQVYNEQSFYKFERCVVNTVDSVLVFSSQFMLWRIFVFLNFYHKITSNIIFAVFLFRVFDCYYFTASSIKFVVALFYKKK